MAALQRSLIYFHRKALLLHFNPVPHLSNMDNSYRSSSPIPNLIQKWVSENYDKVAAAINFKGGWEGWAQVEIAYEMVQAYSTPMISDRHRRGIKFDVTREAKVYSNKPDDRVDLVIHMPGNALRSDARPAYLFELKCESCTFYVPFTSASSPFSSPLT